MGQYDLYRALPGLVLAYLFVTAGILYAIVLPLATLGVDVDVMTAGAVAMVLGVPGMFLVAYLLNPVAFKAEGLKPSDDLRYSLMLQMLPLSDLEARLSAGLRAEGYGSIAVADRPGQRFVDLTCRKGVKDYVIRAKLSDAKANAPELAAFLKEGVGRRMVFASAGGFSVPAMRLGKSRGLFLWGPKRLRRLLGLTS